MGRRPAVKRARKRRLGKGKHTMHVLPSGFARRQFLARLPGCSVRVDLTAQEAALQITHVTQNVAKVQMAPAFVCPPELVETQSHSAKHQPKPCTQDAKAPAEGEHADLLAGLKGSPKQLPCSFLYDEKGSDLYNQITELEEYYPYRVELAMLHEHAADITSHIPKGSVVVELGCGSAQKTGILLQELLARDGSDKCSFVGIDVSADFLQQAKANLLEACPELLADKVELVQAPYLEGLKEARAMHPDEVLCVLWLGSSVGNLTPADTLAFFQDMLRIGGPLTEVLVCTDLWKDQKVLHAAYCDSQGVTEAFIKNGMANAVAAASCGAIRMDEAKWLYDVIVNAEDQQVEMYVIAGESLDLGNEVRIEEGERILIEVSRKFTAEQLRSLAYQAGYCFQAQWRCSKYSIQLMCAPSLAFTLAWRDMDSLFDRLHEWRDAPIDLRHPFCFYYAHVVSFAKIKMLPEEPASRWDVMFSRGIDPDVSDPSKCHSHPDAPQEWPTKDQIVRYVQQVRQQLATALAARQCAMQGIYLALEHDRMHQETLCYMMAQQQKRAWQQAHLLDNGTILENGLAFRESLARWNGGFSDIEDAPAHPTPNGSAAKCNGTAEADGAAVNGADDWIDVPAGKTALGVPADAGSTFVWDNEGPLQAPQMVQGFQASARPVSIADFREFVLRGDSYTSAALWAPEDYAVMQAAKQRCPSTWTVTGDGDVWVHYPEGTRNWREVAERPVWCSLAEAQAFCKARGCRIMTEPEYMLALESDPSGTRVRMLRQGGWEWTATTFAPLPGFKPMDSYPEYSADFFDGKHFVLKGASPYTHPSAVRASFRNFYQGVYPHMFAKFRCCH